MDTLTASTHGNDFQIIICYALKHKFTQSLTAKTFSQVFEARDQVMGPERNFPVRIFGIVYLGQPLV